MVYRNITFGKFHAFSLRSSWSRVVSNICFRAVSTDIDVFHLWKEEKRLQDIPDNETYEEKEEKRLQDFSDNDTYEDYVRDL